MNFIIDENFAARRVQLNRAVVRIHSAGGIRLPIHRAENKIAARLARRANRAQIKRAIEQAERRWRLRPNNRARLEPRRRDAHLLELIHFPAVNLQPILRITHRLRKIQLHQVCDARRLRRRHPARSNPSNENQNNSNRRSGSRAPAFPRALRRNNPEEQRVVSRHNPGEPVNSGDGRNLRERQIPRRRVSQQIPRETDIRQMGEAQLHRHPKKWRDARRLPRPVASPQTNPHREKHFEERARDNHRRHHAGRLNRRQRPILPHHRVNPGDRDPIEREPIQQSAKRSEPQTSAPRRQHQRRNRDPRQHGHIEVWIAEGQRRARSNRERQARRARKCHSRVIVNRLASSRLFFDGGSISDNRVCLAL